jgi:Mg/Co/Ni transporter MgtE
VMTPDVINCFDDQDVKDAADTMAARQIRRLLVLNRDKRLVGIVSLGDLAMADKAAKVGAAMAGISQPGGQHSQTGGSRI